MRENETTCNLWHDHKYSERCVDRFGRVIRVAEWSCRDSDATHAVSPFVRRALAAELPAKEYAR